MIYIRENYVHVVNWGVDIKSLIFLSLCSSVFLWFDSSSVCLSSTDQREKGTSLEIPHEAPPPPPIPVRIRTKTNKMAPPEERHSVIG